jgi:hypothetical protein
MAAVTLLGTATFTTTSGTKTVTATPAVGDLIVIVSAHSANTSTALPTDNNNLGKYTLINTCVKNTSADTLKMFVRNDLIRSASSTVFTIAPGTSTGGGLAVMKITGMSRCGITAAVLQSAIQSNQALGGTPAPVFGASPLTANPIIAAVFNATNPAGVTPRSAVAYTGRVDAGYITTTHGLRVASVDSGDTTATNTWGGTSATAFCSLSVELDTSATPVKKLSAMGVG